MLETQYSIQVQTFCFCLIMVYVAFHVTPVGALQLAPLLEPRDRPAGKDGEPDQPVIVPPFAVGVTVVICVPLVRVNEFGL